MGPAQQSLPPPGGLAQGATTHPLGRFAHRLQRAQNSRLHMFAHPDSSSAQSLALGVACTRQRAFPQSRAVGRKGERRRLSGDVGTPPPFNHDRLPGGGDGCGAGNGGKELARQMGSGRLFPAYGAAWAEGVWAEQGGGGSGLRRRSPERGRAPECGWACERDREGRRAPRRWGREKWGRPWMRSLRSLRRAQPAELLAQGRPLMAPHASGTVSIFFHQFKTPQSSSRFQAPGTAGLRSPLERTPCRFFSFGQETQRSHAATRAWQEPDSHPYIYLLSGY